MPVTHANIHFGWDILSPKTYAILFSLWTKPSKDQKELRRTMRRKNKDIEYLRFLIHYW